MSRTMSRLAAIAVFLIAQAGLVTAAEVKVFSTIGVQAALEELAPKFEQATGNKLNITWATAAILVKRVQAGETADLMVLTKQSLDALTKDNKATAGNDAIFASSGMAVVVKKKVPPSPTSPRPTLSSRLCSTQKASLGPIRPLAAQAASTLPK